MEAIWPRDIQQSHNVFVIEVLKEPNLSSCPTTYHRIVEVANHLDRNIVPGTLLRGLVDDPVRATPYFLMYIVMLEKVILPAVFVSV